MSLEAFTMPIQLLPIQTERLVLRDFVEQDWRAVHRYASDPQVVRYMDWGPNAEAETHRYIDQVIASQQASPRYAFDLAVTLKVDGRLIGGCGFHAADPHSYE